MKAGLIPSIVAEAVGFLSSRALESRKLDILERSLRASDFARTSGAKVRSNPIAPLFASLSAEAVGFEPTWGFPPDRISSAARYDHFATPPWKALYPKARLVFRVGETDVRNILFNFFAPPEANMPPVPSWMEAQRFPYFLYEIE